MENRELKRRLKLANTQIINDLDKLKDVVDKAIESIFMELRKKIEEYTKKLYNELSNLMELQEPEKITRVKKINRVFGRASLLLILGEGENSELKVHIPENSKDLTLMLMSFRDKRIVENIINLLKEKPKIDTLKEALREIDFEEQEGILILQGKDEKVDEEDYILEVFGVGAITLHHFEGGMTRGVPYIMPPQRTPIYMRIRNPFDTGGLFLFGIGKALANKDIKKQTIELMKNIVRGNMDIAKQNYSNIQKLLEGNPIGNTIIGLIRIKPKKPKSEETIPRKEKQSISAMQGKTQPTSIEYIGNSQKLERTILMHKKAEKMSSQLAEADRSSKDLYYGLEEHRPVQEIQERFEVKSEIRRTINKTRESLTKGIVYIFYLSEYGPIGDKSPLISSIERNLFLVIEHDSRIWVEPQFVRAVLDDILKKSMKYDRKIAIIDIGMGTLKKNIITVETLINRLLSNAFYVILLVEDPTEPLPVHPTTIETLKRKINNKYFRVSDARRVHITLYNRRDPHTMNDIEKLVSKYIKINVLGGSYG